MVSKCVNSLVVIYSYVDTTPRDAAVTVTVESPSEHTSESASVNPFDDGQSTVSRSSGAHDGEDMSLSSRSSRSGGSPTPRDSDPHLMADDNNRNGHLITPHGGEQLNMRIVIKGAPNARRNRGSSPNLRRRPMSSETDTRRPASSQN